MTAGSSIDPVEFLHEHLAQASPDLLRELMQGFINTLLSADADRVCGAANGARDPEGYGSNFVGVACAESLGPWASG